MFRQRPATEGLLDAAAEAGAAVLVRLPLASGLLSGKFSKDTTFADGDHRQYNRDGDAFNVGETLGGLTLDDGVDAVESLEALDALPKDIPLAKVALRWVLDHPQVTAVIPGATKVSQVESNIAAAVLPSLGDTFHSAVRTLWQEQVDPKVRGEQ